MRCFLLVILAVGFCHAQRDIFSDQDGFVFPGEADRPSKFPINPSNPTRPFTIPSQRTTERPNTPAVSPVTPNVNAYNQCINNCQTTSEYNPVCGSDNVVYSNPGRLNCAVACGNSVILQSYGQCNGTLRG